MLLGRLQKAADREKWLHVPNAQEIEDTFLTLEPETSGAYPDFCSPHELVRRLDLQLRYEILILQLSDRPSPMNGAFGTVRAKFLKEDPIHFWQGLALERQRQHPQEDAEAREEERGPDEAAELEDNPEDLLQLWLDGLDVADGVVHAGASSSSRSSSTSSRSTSSASGSSSSDSSSALDAPGDDGQAGEAQPVDGANGVVRQERLVGAEGEAAGNAGARMRRPESFHWGSFAFTFKAPAAFQATCRYHARYERTKCTKLCSFNPDEASSLEHTIKALKLWCLRCTAESKASHQGRKGLAALTEAELALTDEYLEAQLRALPPLPE